MLFNYFKIALRNLLKKPGYSLINILGLAIGLTSVGLISMHIEYEYSYDNFHENKEQLYKVSLERIYPTHNTYYDIIPHSFADVMKEDFGEVLNFVRISNNLGATVAVTVIDKNNQKEIYEESDVIQADSTFFEVFTFPFLHGDSETALDNPNDVVLTKTLAEKYFGRTDVVGEVINFGQADFKITGVCEDPPRNSHIQFSMVGAISGIPFFKTVNYTGFSAHTYLLLAKEADARELEEKFPEMVSNYAASQIEQNLGTSFDDYVAAGNGYRYYLRPIQDIHLDPENIEATFPGGGNKTFVQILISVAVLILIIACINFMNLATARATERAKEVGIRKTLGSLKSQLILQFLMESVVITLISLVLSLALINVLLPYFNELTGDQLIFSLTNGNVLIGVILFAILVGLLAGLYPAFVLSSYNPVNVLKGKILSSKSGEYLRNGLVVFQFSVSIILIAGTITIYQQLKYVQEKELGFDKDQIVTIDNLFNLNDKVETFKNEVEALPGVVGVGNGSAVPGGMFFGFQFQQEGSEEVITTKSMNANGELITTLGMQIVQGRNFSRDMDDSLSIILNEAAVQAFGVNEPVGKKVYTTLGNPPQRIPLTIVGVVKDFHFMSLKDQISPLAILNNKSAFGFQFNLVAKVKGDMIPETLASIEEKWHMLAPEQPLKYDFLDTRLKAQYEAEQTSGKIFGIFASLAIFIGCVGLFGLVAFTADQKTKEIGIRKVLGASVSSIIFLLTRHFTVLVVIAFVIASPLIWFGMNSWLDGFAYRINLGPSTFLASGFIALAIAWLTVSYQSAKAAIVNPVNSIGSE